MKQQLIHAGCTVLLVGLVTGCSSVRVRLSGTEGSRYQAAWSTDEEGLKQQSGELPASITLPKGEVSGWFESKTSGAMFRVRVYQGWSKIYDLEMNDGGRRVVVETIGNSVSVETRQF